VNSDAIVKALAGCVCRSTSEADVQRALTDRFTAAGLEFEREYRLNAQSRVDFWFPSVGDEGSAAEVKVAGGEAEMLRQIGRYAELSRVREVVLITTLIRLRVPADILGKPCRKVWIGGPL